MKKVENHVFFWDLFLLIRIQIQLFKRIIFLKLLAIYNCSIFMFITVITTRSNKHHTYDNNSHQQPKHGQTTIFPSRFFLLYYSPIQILIRLYQIPSSLVNILRDHINMFTLFID